MLFYCPPPHSNDLSGRPARRCVRPRAGRLHPVHARAERQPWGRLTEAHIAVGIDRPVDEILALASHAGWPAEVHDRGGFFSVVEVWVEGAFLIEFLDPEQVANYLLAALWRSFANIP